MKCKNINCNNELNISQIKYGGKFCCRSCSNSSVPRISRPESRIKVKNSLMNIKNRPSRIKTSIIECICSSCNKSFLQTKTSYKKLRKTCSEKCRFDNYSINGRKSAELQSIIKRSKNEVYFSKLCEVKFKSVLTNKNIFNGWDADIIIEDFKIAILWNGKWHYEKITQKHSIEQVQNRDKIKVKEIEKMGYVPYIIKDMGSYNKVFVEEKFRELVNWLSQISHKD